MVKTTVILKIRMRNSIDSVLKHLNYWMALFSDDSKYDVLIYNENVALPFYYNCLPTINRVVYQANPAVRVVSSLIDSFKITTTWKGAAFALAAPYFHFANDQYLIQIDADDMMMMGDGKTIIENAFSALKEKSLAVLSYDYLFSKNIMDVHGLMPNHWTFGVTIANVANMRQIILKAFENYDQFMKDRPRLPPSVGTNLDLLMSHTLLKSDEQYVSFIGNATLIHMDKMAVRYDSAQKKIDFRFIDVPNFQPVMYDRHPRSLLV